MDVYGLRGNKCWEKLNSVVLGKKVLTGTVSNYSDSTILLDASQTGIDPDTAFLTAVKIQRDSYGYSFLTDYNIGFRRGNINIKFNGVTGESFRYFLLFEHYVTK